MCGGGAMALDVAAGGIFRVGVEVEKLAEEERDEQGRAESKFSCLKRGWALKNAIVVLAISCAYMEAAQSGRNGKWTADVRKVRLTVNIGTAAEADPPPL